MKVLVTEDDEVILMLYRAILGKYPEIQVKFASSVEECHKLTGDSRFDLVFMDCDLGSRKENGLDLLREIKTNGSGDHVFMATTHDDDSFRKLCFKLGATGLIPKRGNFIELVSKAIEADLQVA